ncbi:MAG: hypothetical protein MZU95_07950 [Desulfomicrobium escambiense]|nr:hypothetical protein [Desulfomicrobium escambiense]
MDITDRKQAEADLEIQRAYFSQLFANSPSDCNHRHQQKCGELQSGF